MSASLAVSLLSLAALAAPPAPQPSEVVVDLPASALPALRALGDVWFYTSSARPLRSLAEIRAPEQEVLTADLGLSRSLMGLLRAGGVPLSGGAVSVARLTSDHHLAAAFRGPRPARLLVMSPRAAAIEERVTGRGGGVRLVFRAPDGRRLAATAAAVPAGPAPRGTAVASGPPTTSFGPLGRVSLVASARTRQWDPAEVRTPQRRARSGQTLVVLHITRDFGAGLGRVSFLFGSGILLEPDFTPLALVAGSRRFRPVGSFAEGTTLELVYEVPASMARQLSLEDGTARWPLAPLIAGSPTAS